MARLSEERLQGLPVQAFADGELLLAAGSATGRLLILRSGVLEVVRDGVVITAIRDPGAIVGEMALLLDGPHTADVVSRGPSECHVIEEAREVLLSSPELLAYVAAVLAHRLDAVNRYLVDLKVQFADAGSHLGMIDEVLASVMARHPRALRMRRP